MVASPASITVDYEEIDVTESFNKWGIFHATRVLQCAWADRLTLSQQLLGAGEIAVPGGPGINVILPGEYPDKSGVFVIGIPSIKGWPDNKPDADGSGAAAQSHADYLKAQLTVEYQTPLFGTQPTGQPRVQETIEPTAEFLTLPTTGLKWEDGTLIDEDVSNGFLQRSIEWVYKVSGIPKLPLATLTLIGRVNASALLSKEFGWTYPVESLLYNPPQLTRYIYAGNNASAWEASFRFTFKENGWNRFFNPKTNSWQKIVNSSAVQVKPYTTGDFTQLVVT